MSTPKKQLKQTKKRLYITPAFRKTYEHLPNEVYYVDFKRKLLVHKEIEDEVPPTQSFSNLWSMPKELDYDYGISNEE